jgi:hypothetical protein
MTSKSRASYRAANVLVHGGLPSRLAEQVNSKLGVGIKAVGHFKLNALAGSRYAGRIYHPGAPRARECCQPTAQRRAELPVRKRGMGCIRKPQPVTVWQSSNREPKGRNINLSDVKQIQKMLI